jgi:excinuclease UvrABC ATPase subunit
LATILGEWKLGLYPPIALMFSIKNRGETMPPEYIEIHGARENNLKNISLRIPKRKITIFTGLSGSGKSSIVFDTIATESQRLLSENFSMFVRNFCRSIPSPMQMPSRT